MSFGLTRAESSGGEGRGVEGWVQAIVPVSEDGDALFHLDIDTNSTEYSIAGERVV